MEHQSLLTFNEFSMKKNLPQDRIINAMANFSNNQGQMASTRQIQELQLSPNFFRNSRHLAPSSSDHQAEMQQSTVPIVDNLTPDRAFKRDFENYLLKFGNNLYQKSNRDSNSFENHRHHINNLSPAKPRDFFSSSSPIMEDITTGFLDEPGSLSPISLNGSLVGSPCAEENIEDTLCPTSARYPLTFEDVQPASLISRGPSLTREFFENKPSVKSRENQLDWPQDNGQPSPSRLTSTGYDHRNYRKISQFKGGVNSCDYCATIHTPLTRPVIESEYPMNHKSLSSPIKQSFYATMSTIAEDDISMEDDYKELSQYFDFSDNPLQPAWNSRPFEPTYDTRMNVVQHSPPYSPTRNNNAGDKILTEDFMLQPNIPISPPLVRDSFNPNRMDKHINTELKKEHCEKPHSPNATSVIQCPTLRSHESSTKFDSRRIITSTTENGTIAYICPDCAAQFRVRGYLVRHMRKHAKVMRFRCPLHALLPDDAKCHSSGGFSRGDTYKMHMKARHFIYPKCTPRKCRTQSTGTCGGCGKEFKNNDIWFKDHIKGKKCPRIWGSGLQVNRPNQKEEPRTPQEKASLTQTDLNYI